MQTFLPYENFAAAVATLDFMRLGKQRVETYQVLQRLLNERLVTTKKVDTGRVRRVSLSPEGTPEDEMEWEESPIIKKVDLPEIEWTREPIVTKGWINHPVVKMWRWHELSLLDYQRATCNEWTSRGYKDGTLYKSEYLLEPHADRLAAAGANEAPSWVGNPDFHASHRANLRRKDESHYAELFPEANPGMPYLWPV